MFTEIAVSSVAKPDATLFSLYQMRECFEPLTACEYPSHTPVTDMIRC